MRKLMILMAFALVATTAAKAQESRGFELTGNYQYVRFNAGGSTSGFNCHGGSRSAAPAAPRVSAATADPVQPRRISIHGLPWSASPECATSPGHRPAFLRTRLNISSAPGHISLRMGECVR